LYDGTYRVVKINGTGTVFFADEEDFYVKLIKDKVLKDKCMVGVRYFYDTIDKGVENTGIFVIDLMTGLFLSDTCKWESAYGIVTDKYELRDDGTVVRVGRGIP
jgi:hypothetical protein